MMSGKDFLHKHKLKKATSNIKKQKVFSSIGLTNIGMYLRDGPFSNDVGIVEMQSTKWNALGCIIKRIFFIQVIVQRQTNNLKLSLNEMDIVYFTNTKFEV